MKLEHAQIVLRPRSLGETLDLAVRFAVRFRGPLGRAALVVGGPSFALLAVARLALGAPWWAVWCGAAVLAPLSEIVVTAIMGRLLFDPEARVAPAAREALARIVPFAVARLGALAAHVALGVFTLGVASLVSISRLAFVPEVVVLERQGVRAAYRRSAEAVSLGVASRVGPALWGLVAAVVLAAEWAGQGVVSSLLLLGEPVGSLMHDGGSLYAIAGSFVGCAFAAVARFLAFIDGRTRSDGWDVQVRMLAVRAADAAGRRRDAEGTPA